MKRLTIALFLTAVAVVLVSTTFCQDQGNIEGQKKPVSPFVEATVPDGKALVYIYYRALDLGDSAGFLVLTKSGPIGILPSGRYLSFVTDPGTLKLWLVGLYATELKLEVAAGQAYYVRARIDASTLTPQLKLIANERAKNDIAKCKQLTGFYVLPGPDAKQFIAEPRDLAFEISQGVGLPNIRGVTNPKAAQGCQA
jgi:hypothetical protein